MKTSTREIPLTPATAVGREPVITGGKAFSPGKNLHPAISINGPEGAGSGAKMRKDLKPNGNVIAGAVPNHGHSVSNRLNTAATELKRQTAQGYLPGDKNGKKYKKRISMKHRGGFASTINNGEVVTLPPAAPLSAGKEIQPGVVEDNHVPAEQVDAKPGAEKVGSLPATKDDNPINKTKDLATAGDPKDGKADPKKNQAAKKVLPRWGFGLSLGPDVSAVNLSNTGKITLAFGGMLSYAIDKKFTVRTGFYVAKKIYSVDNDEYHTQAGSTWNRYLQSVDANCKVYEVPLTVSYNFGKTKNHEWFASAGALFLLYEK